MHCKPWYVLMSSALIFVVVEILSSRFLAFSVTTYFYPRAKWATTSPQTVAIESVTRGQTIPQENSSKPQQIWTTYLDYHLSSCESELKAKELRVPSKWVNNCPKNGIVSVVQGGRLGNQIWEYATMFATAIKIGLPAFVPNCISNNLREYFVNLTAIPLSYVSHCPVDKKRVVTSFNDWKRPEQSIFLKRYSADWSIILEFKEQVFSQFVFKEKLRGDANAVLSESARRYNVTDPTFVGVHVRRDDYIAWLKRRLAVGPASAKYYLDAMDYFETKYDNVVFVVATDSVTWCERNLRRKNKRLDIVSDPKGHGAARDLAVLCACNHSIIDYGTYGTWAGLMVPGEVTVYNITGYFTTNIANVLPNWRAMN